MELFITRIEVKDQQALADLEKIVTTTSGYKLDTTGEGKCDLLLYEVTKESIEDDFDYIGQVLATGAAANVFLVSRVMDPDVLIQALRVGAKEFLPIPLNKDNVRKALIKFYETVPRTAPQAAEKPAKNGAIIYVLGGKGGVGTTTIAVNLAHHLQIRNSSSLCALIDMNLLFGEIPLFLGVESHAFDWAEVARNISRLDASFLMGTLYRHSSGLHILPSPTNLIETLTAGPQIMKKLLELMKTIFDYIIIDGGQDLGDMSKAILKMADKVFIVTLLNLPCLINVKRLLDTFKRLGYPSEEDVDIVANRVHKKSGGVSIEEAQKGIKKPIVWTIPNDYSSTMEAINMGKPLQEISPDSEVNLAIGKLVRSFTTLESVSEKKKSIFGFKLFS